MALDDIGAGDAVGATVSVGMAAAQGGMNPMADLSAAMSVIGLGMKAFGIGGAASAAKKSQAVAQQQAAVAQLQAQSSGQIAQLEKQQNAQREQQMILTAGRQQMQTIRNTQLARSMALNSSTAQGAQFGSGLQGGYGQISGDSNTSLLGVNQNLEIGKNMFGLDALISDQKILQAQYAGQQATYQGQLAAINGGKAVSDAVGSFGTSLGGSAKEIGNVFGGTRTGDTTNGMQSTFDQMSASTNSGPRSYLD